MTKIPGALLLTFGILFAGVDAAAQGNQITFGVDPGQSTTGGGSLAVTVGGHATIPVDVPPGTDSAGIAAATAAALQANGFTATQNGTEVTVTSGPGGAPLKFGGGIGSTDPGITGVETNVTNAPPAGGGAPVGGPAGKQNGGQMNQANPNAQAQGPGSVQVDVEVTRFVDGSWVTLWLQVDVPIQPGDSGDTINSRLRVELALQGLFVQEITLPPIIAPMTPSASLCMDRTFDGGKVTGIGVELFGSGFDMFGNCFASCGLSPLTGVCEYDRAMWQDGTESTDFAIYQGHPGIGESGAFVAFTQPDQLGLWLIAPGFGGPQIQAPIVPLPFIDPNFYLPLDPFALDIHVGFTGPLGEMQLPLPIPNDPLLAGLELHVQAMTLDPLTPSLWQNAARTNPLSLRVAQ